MAGRGPAPKAASLRQRRNKKAGHAVLAVFQGPTRRIPDIPNPDGREWHPLTLTAWKNAWNSPMAGQWLEADFYGLARLALLWDSFNRSASVDVLREIRLQSAAFGLTPLDRSRLQWQLSTKGADLR